MMDWMAEATPITSSTQLGQRSLADPRERTELWERWRHVNSGIHDLGLLSRSMDELDVQSMLKRLIEQRAEIEAELGLVADKSVLAAIIPPPASGDSIDDWYAPHRS